MNKMVTPIIVIAMFLIFSILGAGICWHDVNELVWWWWWWWWFLPLWLLWLLLAVEEGGVDADECWLLFRLTVLGLFKLLLAVLFWLTSSAVVVKVCEGGSSDIVLKRASRLLENCSPMLPLRRRDASPPPPPPLLDIRTLLFACVDAVLMSNESSCSLHCDCDGGFVLMLEFLSMLRMFLYKLRFELNT